MGHSAFDRCTHEEVGGSCWCGTKRWVRDGRRVGSKRPPGRAEQTLREAGLGRFADRVPSQGYIRQIRFALERPSDPRCPKPIKDLIAGLQSMPPSPGMDREASNSSRLFQSPEEERAAAFWQLLRELVRSLGKSERRTAAVAALMMRTERDSALRARIEAARHAGRFGFKEQGGRRVPAIGADQAAQYWVDAKADLADMLDQRIAELVREPAGWEMYRRLAREHEQLMREQARKQATTERAQPSDNPGRNDHLQERVVPDGAQPLYIHRLVDTFVMRGRLVSSRLTERWVEAWDDDVDNYIAHIWSPVGRPAGGTLRAHLNCREDEPVPSPPALTDPNLEIRVTFPRKLQTGDRLFFATQVVYGPDADDSPIAEHGVGACGVAAGGWTVRVQFDDGAHPVAIWSYGAVPDHQRRIVPPVADVRRLDHKLTECGYFEHQFEQKLSYPLKYGIAWLWA